MLQLYGHSVTKKIYVPRFLKRHAGDILHVVCCMLIAPPHTSHFTLHTSHLTPHTSYLVLTLETSHLTLTERSLETFQSILC
jgi:hypothetical protein